MDHERDLELLKQSFPTVTCYCELCDCGRHRHHKDCAKARKIKSSGKYQPKTDYQATYTAPRHYKPRSSKRPAPNRRINPPPLEGKTVQKEEFKPIDVGIHGRPPAYHQTVDYEPPKVPFAHRSTHQEVYVPKPLEGVEHVTPRKETFKLSDNPKFQSSTTNNEYYKDWGQSNVVSFTEPPSFMASMLFPSNKQEEVKSVTRASFPGATAKKIEPAKIPDGNLHIGEGDYDHLTVNRDVYRGKFGEKSKIVIHQPEFGKSRRSSFYGETQTRCDFKGYGPNAGRRNPAQPAPDTIDLKFNNNRLFETEQRETFKGHDTRVHLVPEPSRTEHKQYKKPDVAFETKTCNKVDYIPLNLADASQERASMPPSKWDFGGKFHSETAYNHFYKDWHSPRRPQRYGDFVDGINSLYLPPVQKFVATTTNQENFPPKQAEMRANMKPEAVPIAKQGSHDFETVHRLTYKGEKPPLCKAEAFLLQQELKKRLQAEGIEGSALVQSLKPQKVTVCAK